MIVKLALEVDTKLESNIKKTKTDIHIQSVNTDGINNIMVLINIFLVLIRPLMKGEKRYVLFVYF